jgi:uncharacterized protein
VCRRPVQRFAATSSCRVLRYNTLMMDSPTTVVITGATGLIGSHLRDTLPSPAFRVWPAQRTGGGTVPADHALWDVAAGELRLPQGQRIDAVVHLAGRNIASRWSVRAKKEIWESRVPPTEKLCTYLAALPKENRPRTLLSASAVGIYGDRGDEVLTEESPIAPEGASFLADIGRAWEAATRPAADAGIRVVLVRIGVVLAQAGGALAKMATPVSWGLGGPVGSGAQFMPWISLTDLCRLLVHGLQDDAVHGILNAVAPAPVRQREFIRVLGHVLHRPVVFPLPAFMVKAVFGQMGQEVLLSSLRVVPTRLPAGFTFEHKTLEDAIRTELGQMG